MYAAIGRSLQRVAAWPAVSVISPRKPVQAEESLPKGFVTFAVQVRMGFLTSRFRLDVPFGCRQCMSSRPSQDRLLFYSWTTFPTRLPTCGHLTFSIPFISVWPETSLAQYWQCIPTWKGLAASTKGSNFYPPGIDRFAPSNDLGVF